MSPVGLLLSDGRIVCYPLRALEHLSSSGERLSFDRVIVYDDGRLVSESEQGLFMCMPLNPPYVADDIVGYIDLSGTSATRSSETSMHSKPKRNGRQVDWYPSPETSRSLVGKRFERRENMGLLVFKVLDVSDRGFVKAEVTKYLDGTNYHTLSKPKTFTFAKFSELVNDGELVEVTSDRNDGMHGVREEMQIGQGAQNLDLVNDRFNEELGRLTEENAQSVILNLGMPSPLLLSVGIQNKPIRLYGNKVLKKAKKHGYSIEELVNLPQAVANPIAVFNNLGRDGNRSILTELRTEQGNILVTIDLGKGTTEVDFNIVSSVFGKADSKVIGWLNKGYATYINKRKALDDLRIPAPIAGAQDNQGLLSATKIVESFENPSIKQGPRYRGVDIITRQGQAIDYLYDLSFSEHPYIETGRSRTDEDYEEGDAEREQRLVLRPVYKVRENLSESENGYFDYDTLSEAEGVLRDPVRPEESSDYYTPSRELLLEFEPIWVDANGMEIDVEDRIVYDDVYYEGYELPEALSGLEYGILGVQNYDSAYEERQEKEAAITNGLNKSLSNALAGLSEEVDGRPVRIDASNAFKSKYSSIEVYDEETDNLVGRIQLRLATWSKYAP